MRPIIPLVISLVSIFWVNAQGDFQKGVSYYKQGQYARAIQEFELILEDTPDYEAGYRVIGDCYLQLRKFAKASESFKRAIELDDTKYVSYWGAAVADYNLKRYRDAIATLDQAERLARSPRQKYQLYQTRGSSYYNLEEFRQAITDLEKAVSIQRGVFRDAFQLGVSYYQIGEFDKARPYLEQAVALEASSLDAKRYLARLNFKDAVEAIQSEDYKTAQNLLQRFVEINPQDGEAWFNLGLASLFVEDFQKAEQAFKLSTQYMPDSWEAHDRLGFIYEKTEKFDESLNSYEQAFTLNQDSRISESIDRVKERIRRQREEQ
jgi:tetratricopeptide (TPR) repeat protein